MANADRQHAHELLDLVPARDVSAAVRFLEFLVADPVARTLATAPRDDEPVTEAEDRADALARASLQRSGGKPFDQVVAELGFTLAEVESYQDRS